MNNYFIKKNISKIIKHLLIILLIGFAFSWFFSKSIDGILKNISMSLFFTLAYGLSLWLGNGYLAGVLDEILPWRKNPLKRLIISTITTIFYSTIIIVLINFLFNVFYFGQSIEDYKIPINFVFIVLIVTFVISLVMHSISFFKEWKNAILREEKLKLNVLELEYASLKNQLSPHFLFNSLNALTSLVANNDDAVKFIKNLSDVYRYLLEHKDNEIINLSTEIEFVKSYIYLHKIRFGDNLKANINIENYKYKVVPLSIQLLIENAIKHNIVSEDEPLFIEIYNTKDYIVVENNLHLKNMINNSSKIGLENIKKRYNHLTEKKVIIEKSNEKFIVKIPLLEIGN